MRKLVHNSECVCVRVCVCTYVGDSNKVIGMKLSFWSSKSSNKEESGNVRNEKIRFILESKRKLSAQDLQLQQKTTVQLCAKGLK